MNDILPISWFDAPDDPAGQALYRVNQLEKCFINHYEKTAIYQDFLFCVIQELLKKQVLDDTNLDNAVNALQELHALHLRQYSDQSNIHQTIAEIKAYCQTLALQGDPPQ